MVVSEGYEGKPEVLREYALDYEGRVEIPESFKERYTPITTEAVSPEYIQKLFNNSKNEIIDKAVEKATPKWETI